MLRIQSTSFALLLLWAWSCSLFVLPCTTTTTTAFSVVWMARRGRKGGLKRTLEDDDDGRPKSGGGGGGGGGRSLMNQGRGQEITGVTLPAEGRVKGWEFGDGVRMAAVNVGGRFFALQGECPRCGFELYKGDVVANDPGFDGDCLACPTCSTTYRLATGKAGPPLARRGLAAFVGNLAKTATAKDANRDARAFVITRDDETGQVFCREA